jgi:RNA polymerase sigma-70 factor (ECF subfamily)
MDDRSDRFSQAYDTYGELLYRICVTHIGRSDAEDVLQDVFIRYLNRGKAFQDAAHERRWLIRVAINRCHDLRRRASSNQAELSEEAIPAPDAYGEHELLEAVRALPPKLKSVVILHCCEGYTLEETAKLLRIGLSAAKMRLSRAREKLK